MGQARLRRQEIAALKQKTRSQRIQSFGATVAGRSMIFSRDTEAVPGITAVLFENIRLITDDLLQQITQHGLTRDQIQQQLARALTALSQRDQLDVLQYLPEIVTVISSVWVLVELGQATPDCQQHIVWQ